MHEPNASLVYAHQWCEYEVLKIAPIARFIGSVGTFWQKRKKYRYSGV